MTEIRDRVENDLEGIIKQIQHGCYSTKADAREAILSIKELAVVDREAELPKNPKSVYTGGMSERDVGELDGFSKAIDQVAKEGWVKEVMK